MGYYNYIVDEVNIKILSALVEQKLEASAKEHKLVDVTGFRQIGKSYTLAQFAKKNGYTVIVTHHTQKDIYKEWGVENVYTIYEDLRGLRLGDVVLEEGVSSSKVAMAGLESMGVEIITGYHNYEL